MTAELLEEQLVELSLGEPASHLVCACHLETLCGIFVKGGEVVDRGDEAVTCADCVEVEEKLGSACPSCLLVFGP